MGSNDPQCRKELSATEATSPASRTGTVTTKVGVVATPSTSQAISTLEEARRYYHQRIAGKHDVQRSGTWFTVTFEKSMTHLYSSKPPDGVEIPHGQLVRKRLSSTKNEDRMFDVERSRQMDLVLPALNSPSFIVGGTGQHGREKILLHGPALPGGGCIRIVLRPGAPLTFFCVSAYPLSSDQMVQARRERAVQFP